MKYEKLSEEQRTTLNRMDDDANTMSMKLAADVLTDPATKAAVLLLGKLLSLWVGKIGYKRFSEVLFAVYKTIK
jgi:hypothetical protein